MKLVRWLIFVIIAREYLVILKHTSSSFLSTDFLGEDLVGINFVFFLASTDFVGEDLVGVVLFSLSYQLIFFGDLVGVVFFFVASTDFL